MSLTIVQVVFMFFTFLSFSKPNFVTALTSNFQLKKACNSQNVLRVMPPNLCLEILQSEKKIVSSSNKTEFAIAAIESGISNATNTMVYAENLFTKTKLSTSEDVRQECNAAYNSYTGLLRAAIGEIKLGRYIPSSYQLLIASTDNIDRCKKIVASKKVKDETIYNGNRALPMFGFIAYDVVNDLSG